MARVAVAWVAWVASSREHKAKSEMHSLCECPFYHDLRETLHEHTKLIKNDFVTMGIQEKNIFDEAFVERSLMLSCSIIRKDNLHNT